MWNWHWDPAPRAGKLGAACVFPWGYGSMDGEVAGTGYLSLHILSATLVDDNMGLSSGAGDWLSSADIQECPWQGLTYSCEKLEPVFSLQFFGLDFFLTLVCLGMGIVFRAWANKWLHCLGTRLMQRDLAGSVKFWQLSCGSSGPSPLCPLLLSNCNLPLQSQAHSWHKTVCYPEGTSILSGEEVVFIVKTFY